MWKPKVLLYFLCMCIKLALIAVKFQDNWELSVRLWAGYVTPCNSSWNRHCIYAKLLFFGGFFFPWYIHYDCLKHLFFPFQIFVWESSKKKYYTACFSFYRYWVIARYIEVTETVFISAVLQIVFHLHCPFSYGDVGNLHYGVPYQALL